MAKKARSTSTVVKLFMFVIGFIRARCIWAIFANRGDEGCYEEGAGRVVFPAGCCYSRQSALPGVEGYRLPQLGVRSRMSMCA